MTSYGKMVDTLYMYHIVKMKNAVSNAMNSVQPLSNVIAHTDSLKHQLLRKQRLFKKWQ